MIRILIECQGAEPVAGLAALVEYTGVVPILGISPNLCSRFPAGPPFLETAIVVTYKPAHYVG